MQVTFGGNPVKLIGEEIKVGANVPDFELTKRDLSPLTNKDLKGKIVIYSIVPSIDTGVCSLQTRTFNERASELSDDVLILTVSEDLPFAQARFCAAEGIENADIASDYKTNDFGKKFGFLIDGLMLLARGIVVADRDGKVRYVEYVPEVTHEVNFDKAIEEAKKLV
ncbi:thiol peroxidase [Peptoniphilus sp. GNH]|nr:redoxin family protein [Clostridiales bacterium KA00134]UHR02353.1 thiol peroxidase [Peptoniphilus sp. GNH]